MVTIRAKKSPVWKLRSVTKATPVGDRSASRTSNSSPSAILRAPSTCISASSSTAARGVVRSLSRRSTSSTSSRTPIVHSVWFSVSATVSEMS